jgi:hypothetical protein
MAGRLSRVRALLRAKRVEQAAACGRALTGLLGRIPAVEILPAQQMVRATLTGEILRAQSPVPWPAALMHQLDPSDPAFLPPLGIHPVLAARDQTLIGVPGRPGVAWVDPSGWCGVGLGPSIAVWFGAGRDGHTIGRRPGRPGSEAAEVVQSRDTDGPGILTRCSIDGLSLIVRHWPVVLEGEVTWVVHARLDLEAPAPKPVRLAFAIRPASSEGSAPTFAIERDAHGLWTADGTPVLAVAHHGDDLLAGAHGRADPWHRFSGLVHEGVPKQAGPMKVECPAGQATAAEVYRTTLSPGESFRRLAVIRPPAQVPATLVRTTGQSLFDAARADREGLQASGATVRLRRHQGVFEACTQRLLLDTGEAGMAAWMSAVALARLGYVRRAGLRLGRWMDQVSRDGHLPAEDPADAAGLAWAAGELLRWTQDRAWRDAHLPAWTRLLDRLVDDHGQPGGRAFYGPDGSGSWTAIWRASALLSGVVSLRDVAPSHVRWAMAGGKAREALAGQLGPGPWASAPGRVPDGAAAGMLASAWLGLLPPDHPDVLKTVQHILEQHWHGGGVLLHGGAHPAATALLCVVAERGLPGAAPDPLDALAALASPTGALPTVRHPARGALGEGDDLYSAALFVLMALDRVRSDRSGLTVLPDLLEARELPTPFGRIDVIDGEVRGRWVGRTPDIRVVQSL